MVVKLFVLLFQVFANIVFIWEFKEFTKLIDVFNRIRSLTIRLSEPNRRGIWHGKWHS